MNKEGIKQAFFTLALLSTSIITAVQAAAPTTNPLKRDTASWQELRADFVGDQSVHDGSAYFQVELPYRAQDAALVPIRITSLPESPAITSARIIIDENPAPLAADFTFGKSMYPLDFETRIRVDQYSNVRVIAHIKDDLYMNGRYVKASGGCSAPATKDMKSALASQGTMKFRQFHNAGTTGATNSRQSAQLMIRHPNYSGLQRSQTTQLHIPALFIHKLTLYQGDELLFSMTGGISISENPTFRFEYTDNGSKYFKAIAVDTDGNNYESTFAKSNDQI